MPISFICEFAACVTIHLTTSIETTLVYQGLPVDKNPDLYHYIHKSLRPANNHRLRITPTNNVLAPQVTNGAD